MENVINFKEIFNSIPEVIRVLDGEYNVLYQNKASKKFFSTEETCHHVGRKCYEYLGQNLPCKKCITRMAYETGEPQDKELYVESIGKWYQIQCNPSFNDKGDITNVVESFYDITDIKKNEEELRRSEEKYRTIFETAANLILSVNKDGVVVDCNNRIMQVLGYSKEEFIGISYEKYVHEDYRDETMGCLKYIIEKGVVNNFDSKLIRKNGDVIDVIINSSGLKNINGEFIYTICIVSDVTEERRTLETLKKSTEKLQKSNEELEEFAYIASHDLQEPLRVVSSYCQLLQEDYYDKIDDEGKKYINYTIESVYRMKLLIKELLDFSRVGRDEKDFEKIDLDDLLKEVIFEFHQSIEDTAAKILYPSLPIIYGERFRIKQLFHNLISNSLKFRSEKQPIIEIGCFELLNAWEFSVRDNGIGIDKKYFSKIFKVFQRLYTKEQYPGTGIGLAMCKKIVESHGGRMWLDSNKDSGAVFFFTLPKEYISKFE